MSKPGELHRIGVPKRQAPQGAPEQGHGTPPKAATTPMRSQREHPAERPVQAKPRRRPARETPRRTKDAKDAGSGAGSSFEHAQALMRAVAVGIPILGLIGGGAFVFGLTTLGNPDSSFPMAFVVSLAAMFAMLGGVTIVALVLLRQSRDLANQTETLLNRYLEPDAAASKSIGTLGDAIRFRIEEMSRGVDGIVRQLTSIEKHLQGQTGELLETMDTVEQRARDAGKSLAVERDRIGDVARALSAEVQLASESLDEQVTTAHETMNKASDTLRSAESALAQRIADFSEAAERGAAGAHEAGDRLEQHAARVAEISESAKSAAQTATELYAEQQGTMTKAVSLLNKESGRVEQAFEKQRKMLRELSETAARQSKAIEESISACLGGLDVTLQLAAQRAEAMASTFGEQADSILQAGEDAAGSMMQAAETAHTAAAGAHEAIEAQAAAAARALEDQLGKLREALTGLSDETAGALERQAESSQAVLDQQMSGLRQLVDARLRQARTLFESMTADFTRNLDEQLKALSESRNEDQQDWEAWRNRIGDALEGVRLQARESLQALDQAAGEVESRLAGLPERLNAGADQVRAAMAEKVGALDGIAKQARQAVGELENMLGALPDSVDSGTKRIAQRLKEQARAIEVLTNTAEERVKAVEQTIDRLPARLDDQAERIRDAIDSQMKLIDSLAGTAERRADDIAARHGRADGESAPPAPPARRNRQDLSVQEILAQRQAKGERTVDTAANVPHREKTEDDASDPLPRRSEHGDTPPPRRGQPEAREAALKQNRSGSWSRQKDESPGPDRSEDNGTAPAPSWLRRSSGAIRPDGNRHAQDGAGNDKTPGDASRRPAMPEKVPAIFRKRFTDFAEPSGDTRNPDKPPADDPVRIIRGNSARPAPGAPEPERLKPGPRPEDTDRPHAERPQKDTPHAGPSQQSRSQPGLRQGARTQDARGPESSRLQPEVRKQPERPRPARRSAARALPPKPTPTPPPRRAPSPTAGKDSPADQSPVARHVDPPGAMPGLPTEGATNRAGGWGWSEILAAADRASHDDDGPPRVDPAPGDAAPEADGGSTGGDVGTPELQEIGREIVDSLKGLSVDLRPVWEENLHVGVLRRFLAGDRRALTRKLPILGGMELLTRTRRCYRSDARFRSNVDRFVREFDVLVDQIHGLDAPRAERYMSSQNGRLFILLTQVLTKS